MSVSLVRETPNEVLLEVEGRAYRIERAAADEPAVVVSINGEALAEGSVTDAGLLAVESWLRRHGSPSVGVRLGGTAFTFPVAEALEALPEATGPVTLICETERYDGPIGGYVDVGGQAYAFSWCMDAVTPDRNIHSEPRLFALRPVPETDRAALNAWVERYESLGDELTVHRNPHIYPVSSWQQARMRPVEDADRELDEHMAAQPRWEANPVSHWMHEAGQVFAGIQTFTVSAGTAAALPIWQRAVATALAADDFAALAELFREPPLPTDPEDIYRVQVTSENGVLEKLCDFEGKRLPADFWMSGRYRVQDLSHVGKS